VANPRGAQDVSRRRDTSPVPLAGPVPVPSAPRGRNPAGSMRGVCEPAPSMNPMGRRRKRDTSPARPARTRVSVPGPRAGGCGASSRDGTRQVRLMGLTRTACSMNAQDRRCKSPTCFPSGRRGAPQTRHEPAFLSGLVPGPGPLEGDGSRGSLMMRRRAARSMNALDRRCKPPFRSTRGAPTLTIGALRCDSPDQQQVFYWPGGCRLRRPTRPPDLRRPDSAPQRLSQNAGRAARPGVPGVRFGRHGPGAATARTRWCAPRLERGP
jgi:hypothetical protein